MSRFERFTFADGESPFLSDSAPSHILTQLQSSLSISASKSRPPPSPSKPLRSKPTIARRHISKLTPAIFDAQFRSIGVPLVIEGALDASCDWQLDAFVNSFDPEATFQCRIHGGDGYAKAPSMWQGRSHARHVVDTTPRKFAETITGGIAAREDCYVQADIQATVAGGRLKSQLARIGVATGLQNHRRYGPIVNMWWGPPGHTEPLHMDATDGTLCQLRGQKRVVLFPPTSWRDLYPFPVSKTGMSWAFAQVVQSKPDFAAFPRLKHALEHRVEVVLQEGEVCTPCLAPSHPINPHQPASFDTAGALHSRLLRA